MTFLSFGIFLLKFQSIVLGKTNHWKKGNVLDIIHTLEKDVTDNFGDYLYEFLYTYRDVIVSNLATNSRIQKKS